MGGVRSGLLGKATVTFSSSWEELTVELTIDTRGPGPGFIELDYEERTADRELEAVRYRVYLDMTRPQFGGQRYWFICPGSGRRAAKLYLPYGGSRFLSRGAYRLGYACQREDRQSRLVRRARKLHRAIGGDGEALGQGPPDKPIGMHWRTYERRLAAWEAAEERAWANSVMRRLGPPHGLAKADKTPLRQRLSSKSVNKSDKTRSG
jgi:hypothetical protein